MRRPVKRGLTYDQTKTLLAVARDEGLRGEMREVLQSAGLRVQTQLEWESEVQAAEARGRREASTAGVAIRQSRSLEGVPGSPAAGVAPLVGDSAEAVPALARGPEGTSLGVASVESAGAPPALVMSSVYREGEPQEVTLHAGGPWGLRIVPCRISL